MINKMLSMMNMERSISKIFNDFEYMLAISCDMLQLTQKIILGIVDKDENSGKIYEYDKKINDLKRRIVQKILVHMQLYSRETVAVGLALMSISKDAERIGDYVKNLIDIEKIKPINNMDNPNFKRLFAGIGEMVAELIIMVNSSVKESNHLKATEAITSGRAIARACENIISQTIESDASIKDGATLVLGARYYKRIALHLANIASSVVNPLPKIDFY